MDCFKFILIVTLFVAVGSVKVRKIKDKDYWVREARNDFSRILAAKNIEGVAKNVIILIGDGMGVETVTASRIYKGEAYNQVDDEVDLSFDKWPNVALMRTMCTDRMVGSSGCTASALMTGSKTRDSVLNVDDRVPRFGCKAHTKDMDIEPITYAFQRAGKSTGIVTNTRITHATPAAGFGNTVNRYWEGNIGSDYPECKQMGYKDLAVQLLEKGHGINVLFGGGGREFLPGNAPGGGVREDGRNIFEEWDNKHKKAGHAHKAIYNMDGFNKLQSDTDYVLGLFATSHMRYEEERAKRKDQPSLTQMVTKAIQILRKNPKGFFLMVESGRIDHAHHESLARLALSETVEFDKTIAAVQTLTNPEDTLVIVTADHAHVFNIGDYPHVDVPILGLSNRTYATDNMPNTVLVYGNGPGTNFSYPNGRQNLTNVDTTKPDYRFQGAVPMKEESHAGGDVAAYARGVMAHHVRGVHHQTYINEVMRYAACLEPYDITRRCQGHDVNDVTKPIMTPYLLAITMFLTITLLLPFRE